MLTANGHRLAQMYSGGPDVSVERREANARLAAQSPTLARDLIRLREALREVMEDHAWHDELWRFTDETEAVLAALEVPDERAG